MRVELQPGAVEDLHEAQSYLERVEPELSHALATDLDRLFDRLKIFPRSAPSVAGYEDVHRATLIGFPYVVLYRLWADRIQILRILHGARRPPEELDEA